jgi:GNAT superfamily N-acetyltransferase
MLIREATTADRASVVGLGLHFAGAEPAFATILEGVTEESLGGLFDRLLEADYATVFIAEDRGGDVFGSLAIAVVPHLMTGQIFAEELAWWVSPSRRGMLAGPRLLEAAVRWARDRGCKHLKMGAPAGSSVGEFYLRNGFYAVETAYLKVL